MAELPTGTPDSPGDAQEVLREARAEGLMDEALKIVVNRRNQRLEELLDDYEEEPAFAELREANEGIVIPTGSVMARVMFVGFSPGVEEDRQGLPFVGPAGRVLDDLLSLVGMTRHEVYLTNVIKYRVEGMNDRMVAAITSISMKYLRREIAIVKPLVLVPLGADVLRQIDSTKRLSQAHGQIIVKKDRSIVPMYHPAACLRDDTKRADLLHDIQAVRRAHEGYEP